MSNPMRPINRALSESWQGLVSLIHEWRQLLFTSAALLVMALMPSSYCAEFRERMAFRIVFNTAPILVGFSLIIAVVALVLTHIVVVTAHSYGLSHLGLQLVIRVLVLELIPLTAAVFVAIRCTIPDGAELGSLLSGPDVQGMRDMDWMLRVVLPRVVAGVFAGCLLAALASVLSLLVAYLVSYGFSLSGLGVFIRLFGQVFNLAVSVILVLKILLLSLIVTLLPLASALVDARSSPVANSRAVRTSAEMRTLVRMALMVLVVEVASLMGNYA